MAKRVTIEMGPEDGDKDSVPESGANSVPESGAKGLWDPARCAVS